MNGSMTRTALPVALVGVTWISAPAWPAFFMLAILALAPGIARAAPEYRSAFLTFGSGAGYEIAVGDLDGDLIPDVVSRSSTQMTIRRGLGDGTFVIVDTLLRSPGTFAYFSGVAIADLDGDGDRDVVATVGAALHVYLGAGDMTFSAPVMYGSPGSRFNGAVVAQIVGDGNLDVLGPGPDYGFRVFPGTGGGAFGTPVDLDLPGTYERTSRYFTTGDLDGNGEIDVVASVRGNYNGDTVLVFLQTGAVFGAATAYPAGFTCATGDFDEDGNLDVLSGTWMLRGIGDGTFDDPEPIAGVAKGSWTADLDGDGHLDVLSVDSPAPNYHVQVRLGHGDGTFGPPHDASAGGTEEYYSFADLNLDGRLDMVGSAYVRSTLNVHLGNGDGTFGTVRDFPAGNAPNGVWIAQATGDALPDLAVISQSPPEVRTLKGLGGGNFALSAVATAPAGLVELAVGDFNGDAIDDLACAGGTSKIVSVFLGTAGSGYGSRLDFATPGNVNSVAARDLNGDLLDDLLFTQGGAFSIKLATGAGNFGPRLDYPGTSTSLLDLKLAFMNADSYVDFVSIYYSGGSKVVVWPGTASGLPGTAGSYGFSVGGNSGPYLAVGDFTGDGKTDALASDGGSYALLTGNGDGTLGPNLQGFLPNTVAGFLVRDMTADGKPDLVAYGAGYASNTFIFPGLGSSFAPSLGYGGGSSPRGADVGDLDGDGIADIVQANYLDHTVSVFLHTNANVGVPNARPEGSGSAMRLFPNPARGAFRVELALRSSEPATIEVFDLSGRRLERVAIASPAPGVRTVILDRIRGSAGLYWVRFSQGATHDARRMVTLE